eukprot:TRINITY_DN7227_c0_g1_i2.p1 TRINITY_DN7227_c0_g1~~TRINITY_DN7227_c0_g1_i2.p1  ORF type:complete len:2186 (-),score=220.82 TRINITY_DN7227_c0_g1_i2:579-7136(-)
MHYGRMVLCTEHLCWPDRTGKQLRLRRGKMLPQGVSLFVCLLVLAWTGRALADNLQAPRFITQPSASGSIVAVGRTKILQCQALGFPQPQYRWLKDGDYISGFSSEHFYKIQSVTRPDAGSYQCIAKNSVGSIISEMIPLSVAFMTSFPENSGGTVRVKMGHAAVFTFPSISSEPAPSVTWQSDDNTLLYGTKYATTADNKLIILNVDETDAKRYRARATNTQLGQEENSEYIGLEVDTSQNLDVSPEIIVPPQNVTIARHKSVTELQCIANARPLHLLSLIWLKDDKPIEQSGIPYSFNDLWNRTLSLISIDFVHDGIYTCQVKMRTGGPTLSESARVRVIEKPHFKSKMMLETLGEFGKEFEIPCDVAGSPRPNVTWYRDAEPLSNIPAVRYNILGNDSLHINYMRREDSGMFQCSASNEAGYITGYTWLRVKTSVPILIEPPANLTALDGKDATISCTAEGAPAPNITWYFNGGQISFSGRIQILEDGSLLIATVRSTDHGKYTCIRTNEAGSVEGSAWLKVLVRTQIIQPPSDTKVILGHVAKISCRVSSDSGVGFDVSWFHEGKLINDKASHRINLDSDGTLQIAEARASDAGQYACEVKSSGGNDRRTAKLDVIELPYAPTSIVATKINNGQKAVNVSWTTGFDGNSPIIKHIVQFRYVPEDGTIAEDNLNWITALANISSAKRSVELANLRSSAAYIFRVSSVNSVGEGPPSRPSSRVILPQEPPSAPPLGFAGSARSESEIMIQWQPPTVDAQNGDILGYIVRYRLFGYHDSPWNNRNITQAGQRNYLITELITWKDYEVQIAAYNRKGVGTYTDTIKRKTREGVPEAAPTNIRAPAVGSTAVKVTWLPPDPQKINGINQGYKLQAWRGDPKITSQPEKTVTVHPNVLAPLSEQTALIEDLKPWTAYNITVLCFTSPGDGIRSKGELVRTEQDYPGPVKDLKFEEITDRGVRVKWEKPEFGNGIILGYTVRYMVKDMIHTLMEKNLTEDTLSFYLNQLKPTTHYTFEVYAWTEVGRGEANIATIQSGVEPVLPEPPTRLAVSNIEAFSAVLQFTPGFDGNSSITKWSIEAFSARNASWTTIYEVTDPEASTITVGNLIPYMEYSLRLVANNVVGASEPSLPTKKFQTIQADPKHAPQNVTIRAFEFTKLNVRWIPLSQQDWYGVPRGYNISYRILGDSSELHSLSIENPAANSFVLDELEEFTLYEIILQAYNDVGTSQPSPVVIERTNEATPGDGPKEVNATSTSSTTILVSWGEVKKSDHNGIIEGYKVYYGGKSVPFQYKNIKSNTTMQTTLTELKKFTSYSIQVLAYTRIGDGVLSGPPIQVTTFEDVPGPPSNISFPDVSFTTARIIWDVPQEPNGEIKAYKVNYHLQKDDSKNFSKEFLPTDRTFSAVGLDPMSYYQFSVTAKTALGWGYTTKGLVYTTNNREAPQPPSAPQISPSQIQDRDLTFSWTPGSDGYAPLRYYTVQYSENYGSWQVVTERVDPTVTTYTVYNLRPFTEYRFRIQATNDIGPSGWSEESNSTKTLPAAPSSAVENLKVTPITRTDVRVTWNPLQVSDFNGDVESGGYKIEYREVTDFPSPLSSSPQVELKGVSISEVVLNELIRDKNYEITVIPFNSQGLGQPTRPVAVYVGEAVPTGAPRNLKAEAVSPTEIRLSWMPPEADQQNGDLLGYKIFYQSGTLGKSNKGLEVISASHNSHSLIFLDMYTNYTISLLGFNPAGEGPASEVVSARTLQGIPGPPSNLTFSEITMNSLKVSWDKPLQPNGEILGYNVAYETAKQDENYSKQVKQRVSENFMYIHNLEERIPYTFSVRAQTIEYGPAAEGNVTTGPQPGSPGRPRDLLLSQTLSAIRLSWVNGNSGKGPILGYYIESRPKDLDEWKTEIRTNGGAVQDYTISYQNLDTTTTYYFRVIAYNEFGISVPCTSEETVETPSKVYLEYGYSLQAKPFYREVWFVVALAAASIVIIIMVVAILCVKSKTYKYKEQAKEHVLNEGGSIEEGFSTFEMRQSRRGTMSKRGTMKSTTSRKSSNLAMINSSRAPPRPTPSMVNYSDEDSGKGYDENPDDSDSLTEKPSEISSTDSQGTESEQDSGGSDPHSFVNHYANVNNTFRQSWKKQKPVQQAPPKPTVPSARGYSSFTESSDQDGNSAVVSLNGTQLVMNNKARSRAPLPGFSSFV